MTKKHGKCWYSQADLGLGINLTGSGGFCCVPAFHPSRLQLTSIHTRLHTYTHTHTALSSRVSSCLANAVQIEGAIHLLTVPKSKGEKHVGQTNSQPWVTEREEISQALPKHKQRHTHARALAHGVCNSSLYLRARASGYLFKRLSEQS